MSGIGAEKAAGVVRDGSREGGWSEGDRSNLDVPPGRGYIGNGLTPRTDIERGWTVTVMNRDVTGGGCKEGGR
jgi:hypothetical protein